MDGGLSSGFGGGLYSTQAGVRFRTLAGGVGLPISASGPPPVVGTMAVTLGAKTIAGLATVGVAASLAKTLAAKTLAGTATVGVSASLAQTLAAKTVASTATVGVEAALAVTLAAKTVAATATVTTPGASTPSSAYWFAAASRPRIRRRR